MNDIFSNLLDVCVVIYLDDILIYSNNMSEHHWHVKKVLKYLCKTSLYAKVEKQEFHSKSVEYLEYILSPSGLTISDNKVKIIQDWLEPKKVKDIQSYLGFANFYCQFIFNYSDIVILLTCFCHMQVHPSGNYIPTMISSPNHTSLPSMVATFLATCLMVVLQLSEYSVFHSRDTPIQLGLS